MRQYLYHLQAITPHPMTQQNSEWAEEFEQQFGFVLRKIDAIYATEKTGKLYDAVNSFITRLLSEQKQRAIAAVGEAVTVNDNLSDEKKHYLRGVNACRQAVLDKLNETL